MDQSKSIEQCITEAKSILNELPSVMSYNIAKKKIMDVFKNKKSNLDLSRKELQLSILAKEHESKQNEFLKKYNAWFYNAENLLKSCQNEVALKKLKESKQYLMMEQKLKAGISALNLAVADTNDKNRNAEKNKLGNKLGIREMLAKGENEFVEFKSSVKWDYKTSQANKHLEIAIAKSICAFLNSNGGILFIGVDDNSRILGIEKDYPFLLKKNADGFKLYLVQMINNKLGKQFNRFISIDADKIEGKEICIVRVNHGDIPAFLKYDDKVEFYIRASVSSVPLNVREAVDYIKMRWKK